MSRNLAARMGRWSALHCKTATFGWLAFVAVCATILFSGVISTEKIDTNTSGPGESGRVERILDAEFKLPAGESILVQSETLTSADPPFRAAVEDALASLRANPDVQKIESPLAGGGQVSEDGRSVLVEFEIRGDPDDAMDKVDAIIAQTEAVQRAHPELFVGQFGDASSEKALEGAFGDDLAKAGKYSVPITLIILVVVFGALVAASIPLVIGLTAVVATLGLIALPSQILPVDQYVSAIVLLIGLAVGVDYAMFYLKRAREERAAGRSETASVEAAAATSGRSVLISGLTVMVAMAGMFLTGDQTFASFGLGTMMVVAIAVIGSLTVLPAVLARLGDDVERGRIPFLHRLRRDDGEGRFWGAITVRVLRRPVLSAVLAGGLLLALAAPALQLRTAVAGPDTYPRSLAVMTTYDRVQAAFPGTEIPAVVVVQAPDVTAPDVRQAIAGLEQRALASGQMHGPTQLDINDAGTVATISIPIDGEGTDDDSNAALTTLRDQIVPNTVGALPNAETGVTGITAASRDFGDQMNSVLPLVFGFVLLLAFGLMLFAFRSVVIAVKAILLNLLSVAAAYGVLVLVFQHGWGKGLLGFENTDGINPVIPIMLFVILFGLSMDYHVFILSRIRELYDRGASTDQAILGGIKSTAGVVTSAAVVMVGVFAVFGALSMLFFKQFGVGLAAAVLIEATILRAVLLPAAMKLLGDANWYLPRWLDWLPGKPSEHRPEPVPAPAETSPTATPAGGG